MSNAGKVIVTALEGIAAPAAVAIAAILSLTSSYGGLGGVMQRIGKLFSDVKKKVSDFAKAIGFHEAIDRLKNSLSKLGDGFKKIYDALGKLKPI